MSFRYIATFALWFSLTAAAFGQQPNEIVKEEMAPNPDGDGKLALIQRTVTRESTANGSNRVVTETYSSFIPGVALGPGSPLELAERISVTTTPMMNGDSQTITETEERVPFETSVVMQLVARKVETVRQIAPGVWETQRQTFGLDGNGRLALIFDEKETAEEK